MQIVRLFDNITDIPGVEGACLLETTGRILFKRMPDFIPDTAYEEAIRRIIAMYETMDENFLPGDDYLLKFSGKWVMLRRSENLILLLLTGEGANLMSVRMVTNMALKHVTPAVLAELVTAAEATPVAAAGAPVNGSAAPSAAPTTNGHAANGHTSNGHAPATNGHAVNGQPVAAKQVRMYRGQVVAG